MRTPLVLVATAGVALLTARDAQAAQFTVSTTADSGANSLPGVVTSANASTGNDEILFDSSLAGGVESARRGIVVHTG